MGKTNIEYADQVSNPLQAVETETAKKGTFCEKPDPEGTCKNCWAETLNLKGSPSNRRFGNGLEYNKANRDRVEWIRHEKEMSRLDNLNRREPMSEKFPGNSLIVFTNDTYDLFQPSISDELRDWVFDSYDRFRNLTLLIQSTYVAAMRSYLTERYPDYMPSQYVIGMSAGTQKFLNDNARHLLAIKADRRYVIFEPLLEKVTTRQLVQKDGGEWDILRGIDTKNQCSLNGKVHQLIIGGESGGHARTCDVQWIRSLVSETRSTDTAVLVKQLGSKPVDGSRMSFDNDKIPIQITSRKGGKLEELPEDLRIREFAGVSR